MEYRNEVTINLPVDRVIELMDDPENMKEWQPGLLRYELLSDNPHEEGAK